MRTPPKIFLRFFRWYCRPKLLERIEGDLLEVYQQRVKKNGKRKADIKFITDVLLLLRPAIIKPIGNFNFNHTSMFKNYFRISWRNLVKNKMYSSIKIGGFA